ncbi:TetR/AcrR family transcriptional regulator [Tenacibaculum agarivorans]|uniref:TetR/AcrR family transcriptional regulator n=1 Tax=Tenacibaculum agarivorans TaxID=1908389 RepID=UPI00094B85A2|nr:TetR/AcrR family transcriptional regulator [Tenacibaculum agarivorans]
MAGRPKHFQEDELISKATNVFWKKGYTAASAQDLMQAMEIGQGSFYRTFSGGKKELYQKSLKKFLNESITLFYQKLEETENPIQFIKDFFYRLPTYSSGEKDNGCYLGNAIVELSNIDEETRCIAANQLNKLQEGFKKALYLAKEKGILAKEKSPELIALHLINLWNGINITQRINPNNDEIIELLNLNLSLLD